MTTEKKLRKSRGDKVMFGVCGGVAEYFGVDSTLVRLGLVLFTVLSGGAGVPVYIVMAIVMPNPEATIGNTTVVSEPAHPLATGATASDVHGERARGRNLIGLMLIGLGVLFLAANLGAFNWFRWFRWDIVFPVALIAAGLMLVIGRMGTRRA